MWSGVGSSDTNTLDAGAQYIDWVNLRKRLLGLRLLDNSYLGFYRSLSQVKALVKSIAKTCFNTTFVPTTNSHAVYKPATKMDGKLYASKTVICYNNYCG